MDKKLFEFDVLPGWKKGTKVTFENEGGVAQGYPPTVKVCPPPTVESPPPVPRALGLPPSGSFCSGGALAMGGRATVLLESGMGRHL